MDANRTGGLDRQASLKMVCLYLLGQNYRKINLLKRFSPQIRFCLFTFRPIKTVRKLDYNRLLQLSRWGSGNASAMGARDLGFDSRLRQGDLFWFCVLLLLRVYFLSINTLYVNLLSILNLLQDLWPIIRI